MRMNRVALQIARSSYSAPLMGLALFILLQLLSCRGDSRQGLGTGDQFETKEILTQAAPPYPEPWLIDINLVIGIPSGNEDYVLRVPRALTVLEGGMIVILDHQPLQLRVYDSEGLFIRAFGQQGHGPTDLEFRGTNTMVLRKIGQDRFEYWRGWPSVRQQWNVEGELIGVESIPSDHPIHNLGRPYHFGTVGESVFALIPHQSVKEKRDTPTSLLIITDWAGRTDMQIVEILEFDWTSLGGLQIPVGMAQAESDHYWGSRYLVTTAGKIYASTMGEDWIHMFDGVTGDELRRFRLALDNPMSIPPSAVRPGDEGAKWWQENTWQAALVEGPQGQVWVQRTFEPTEDRRWPTDIFSGYGEYLGRLEIPFEPRTLKIKGNQMYGFGYGVEGHPIVIRCSYRPLVATLNY